jgi:tRNA(Leu) C34 or U34 (ribose-2'-O)-methylase TrmL
LKLTSSKPAKYAETIGKRKFIKLSSSRQHEYLAYIARETLKTGDFPGFLKRYDEMQSWVDLDRYIPPAYLTEKEALHEYFLFHNNFTSNPKVFLQEKTSFQDSENITWTPRFNVTVVLDQVRSPYNVGSVLRLIDNFGFRRLVHNSEWLRIDHPQLCKSARGCQHWIPVEFKSDLVNWLTGEEIPVVGLETSHESIDINEWKPEKACVLIIGNEAYGIAAELLKCCETLVKIPMFGFKKSMNLHNTLAIAGYRITAS